MINESLCLNYKKVGHIKGALGLKGELLVHIPAQDTSWAFHLKKIELRNQASQEVNSYSVVKAAPYKGGLRVLLDGIKDRTQAETFRGMEFFISADLLVSKAGEVIYLSEILGFEVFQEGAKAVLGEVIGLSSNGAQDLLRIRTSNGVFEAPFVNAFIIKIDFEARRIIVNLPEGLDEFPEV